MYTTTILRVPGWYIGLRGLLNFEGQREPLLTQDSSEHMNFNTTKGKEGEGRDEGEK